MKKVLSLLLVISMMLTFVPIVQADEHFEISLNGEWEFKYFPNVSDVPKNVEEIVFEDKISVPGAMELQSYGYPSYFYEEMTGWGMPEDDGVRSAGVYKTEFVGEDEYSALLVFESFEDKITVFLNGEKVGESSLAEAGFVLEVSLKEGKNELICIVERDNSGINKKDDFNLSGIMGDVKVTNGLSFSKASKNVEIKDNTLTIDGEKVVLKGIKYTPTHPEWGNTLTNEKIDTDLSLIKEYGFNCVWTSCAPDYFYEKAQEVGLYVIDEANVNLANIDRDMETAKKRVQEMVERHFGFESIIMWSVGSGEGNAQQLINEIKALDNRPVAQEVNFAEDFKVFGNTGGMSDWVETLGKGNVGGFVDEFADKELFYTQSAYLFDATDSVTGEAVTIDGEVENYMGVQYLGDASYERQLIIPEEFTIVTKLSTIDGDRVIFSSGNVLFELRDNRIRANIGDVRLRADAHEGVVALTYASNQAQLYSNGGFSATENAVAEFDNRYTVGGGETALEYVDIYSKTLSLDEMLTGTKENLISSVSFDNINIKEDKSYKFLAYGGDFGDNPNSYYKCLTGIFSSTREPHVEAEMFKQLLSDKPVIGMATVSAVPVGMKIAPVMSGSSAVWQNEKVKATVSEDGKITSYIYNGKELLTDAMYPQTLRENTLSENEMGVYREEGWKKATCKVENDVFYVTVKSTVTDAKLEIGYYVTEDGAMHISMQSHFADSAQKPTFIGFGGAGEYDVVSWVGKEMSSYPDRMSKGATTLHTKTVDEMTDNYSIMQENGNKVASKMTLTGNDKVLGFSVWGGELNFAVHNYSPEAMRETEKAEDVKKEDKAYFRVGGYISGLSGDNAYKLNNNVYGFDFSIIPFECENCYCYGEIVDLFIPADVDFTAFTHLAKDYVVNVNNPFDTPLEVWGLGSEYMNKGTDKVRVGDYTVYFAPKKEYLSDMTYSGDATVSCDSDFNGNAISIRGNGWDPATVYEKGVAIKGGSVTYTIPDLTNHTFTAVIGKADFDWRRMGMGFDRNMFDATSTVTISLDDKVVYEKNDVSMRSGSERVSIDVSGATYMTITVKGSGRAANYEDAVLADAVFLPNGPVVLDFVKEEGKAEIMVLNTDKEYVDVVLTATENGVVTSEAVRIRKGLYEKLALENIGETAHIEAYVTDLGKIVLD